ncbi:MAG: hypothetical protein AAF066_08565 [Pseudomonadota bacterium]
MRMTVFLVTSLMLVACGRAERFETAPTQYQATRNVVAVAGPISQACRASGRSGSKPQICNCIQAAANRTLTAPQQARAAAFYQNLQEAQDVRTSQRLRDEQFWEAYRTYGEHAEALCAL